MILLLQKTNRAICDLDELFDIFCYDSTQRHGLEKQHRLRMTEKGI